MDYDVRDLGLAPKGKARVEWAAQSMPVLKLVHQRFAAERPLAGMRLAACLHVTTGTGNLMRALKAGGGEIALCASNPLSTQAEVAARRGADEQIPGLAIRGVEKAAYSRHVQAVLTHPPHL